MRNSIVLLLFGFCFSLHAQNEKFTLADMNRLVSISSLQISPDGSRVLFSTSKRNMEQNRFDRSWMLMTISTKTQNTLASNIPGMRSVSWKENQMISAIGRSDKGSQVFTFNLETYESQQITYSDNGIVRYAWSPDGKKLAYFVREKEVKKTGTDRFDNSFEAGNNDYLIDQAPLKTSVWVVDADGNGAKKITPEGFTVATGLSTSALSWSPNSELLAFTGYPSAYSGDSDLGRNYIYELSSGALKPATDNKQRESSPRFGPNSKSLIYKYPRDGFPSNTSEWHQVNLKTGEIRNISRELNRSTSDIRWQADGSVLMRATDKWGNAIFHIKDGKHSKLNIGDLASVSSWSMAQNGGIVLTGLKKDYPIEVYYKADLDANPIQLTTFNAFVKNKKLGQQEGFEWESSDGLRPNGILTYPPNFDPNKKYPLVLQIHGGPSSSSLLGFSTIPQAMASKGWIVFQPNYRGSTNLGNDFQAAISKDPSEGPGHDVITGVNALKEKPYIDSEKISVSGWSYGGWMTSWLIGRYPEVWSSAVAGAAPVDLTDMYSLNDLNRMKRHSMVESPYVGDNLDWAYKNSPISNFSRIKAPTLIMSKTGDARVTITGSYKLHGALRDNGIPVQFIAYPGPGHFPSDPVRSLDVYTRWIQWIEKYVGNEHEAVTLGRK